MTEKQTNWKRLDESQLSKLAQLSSMSALAHYEASKLLYKMKAGAVIELMERLFEQKNKSNLNVSDKELFSLVSEALIQEANNGKDPEKYISNKIQTGLIAGGHVLHNKIKPDQIELLKIIIKHLQVADESIEMEAALADKKEPVKKQNKII